MLDLDKNLGPIDVRVKAADETPLTLTEILTSLADPLNVPVPCTLIDEPVVLERCTSAAPEFTDQVPELLVLSVI